MDHRLIMSFAMMVMSGCALLGRTNGVKPQMAAERPLLDLQGRPIFGSEGAAKEVPSVFLKGAKKARANERRLQFTMPTISPFSFNNNWASSSATQGTGQTLSQGQGNSSLQITNSGIMAGAAGTGGAAAQGNFANSANSFGVGNSVQSLLPSTSAFGVPQSYMSGYAATPSVSAFNNDWAMNSMTNASAQSMALGAGTAQLQVGTTGIQAQAQGTQGTQNTGSFNQSANSFGVGNAFVY